MPSEHDELIAWLFERWQELDDWIGEWITDASPQGRPPRKKTTIGA